MKKRLKDEGADQLLTNCKQLKMKSADGCNTLQIALFSFDKITTRVYTYGGGDVNENG
jgi:hypothetical protein